MVQDADGKDVSYERLLLPFGSAGKVEQIVGSLQGISIEGGFKVNNLMGISPGARSCDPDPGRHRPGLRPDAAAEPPRIATTVSRTRS